MEILCLEGNSREQNLIRQEIMLVRNDIDLDTFMEEYDVSVVTKNGRIADFGIFL